MAENLTLNQLGEIKVIKIIEDLIFEKTAKRPMPDDAFFFSLMGKMDKKVKSGLDIVFNTDMLVSTTDVPKQMSGFQVGRKAVLMNISDLIVKGVKPEGIFISLGMPGNMKLSEFKEVMLGMIEYNKKLNIDYIGGDLNQTKELIINPSVFGFKEHSKIIHRNGLKPGNILVSNGKFGLTGVGFDILVSKEGSVGDFPNYKKSIMSVLEPQDLGNEAFPLAENNFATASIDSSDGLNKSLIDLMIANPTYGFEIEFGDNLFDKEALDYSLEFNIPLQNLVFKGGEEFFHLFTIDEKNLSSAQQAVHKSGGKIYQIGRVIPEEKIYYLTQDKKIELKDIGFEHFK